MASHTLPLASTLILDHNVAAVVEKIIGNTCIIQGTHTDLLPEEVKTNGLGI